MRHPTAVHALLLGAFTLSTTAFAQRLVVDLNQTPPTTNPSSSPSWLRSVGTSVVFAASDGRHGTEPWRTDATATGTTMLADIAPGAASGVLAGLATAAPVALDSTVLFPANDGNTGSLWRSDGTAAGTTRVRTFASGLSSVSSLTRAGQHAYFAADDGVHGVELWRSDGTPTGTTLVLDLTPGNVGSAVRNLAAFGTDLVFVATLAGSTQLWRTDGTAAGTALLYDFGPTSPFTDVGRFAERAGGLVFVGYDAAHGNEPWHTDGTAAGTTLLGDLRPGTGSSTLYIVTETIATASGVYFGADDGSTGTELWCSDGTAAGTRRVLDLNPTGSGAPRSFLAFGAALVFQANDGSHGTEPWVSDGTPNGTRLLRDIRPGTASSTPIDFTVLGGGFCFSADDGTRGRELWRSDATTSGTVLVRDVQAGAVSSNPTAFALHAGQLLFAADDGVVGNELWRTDGTAAGTTLVADIARPAASGASVANLTPFRQQLAFTADDGSHGVEPWLSDGTAAGTQLLADLTPGASGSTPTFLATLDDLLLLGAHLPGQGWALLRSDGTTAGTEIVRVVNSAAAASPPIHFAPLGRLGARLVLAIDDGVHGSEPWYTDGTSAGTALLGDLTPGATGSSPSGSATRNGELYFFTMSGLWTNRALWKTDGTPQGTVALIAGNSFPPANLELAATRDVVLFTFASGDSDVELWRTDGTPANTARVMDLRPGPASSQPSTFAALDAVVMFVADDGVNGRDLWRSDGSITGTFRVADLTPSELVRAGDLLMFAASDAAHGRELWRSDGSIAGTQLVADIAPGTRGSAVSAVRSVGSSQHVVLQATHPDFGSEVWTSDGTTLATVRLSDLEPGALDAAPTGFVRAGTQVFFVAAPFVVGAELHVMPLALTGAPLVERFGRGCTGSDGRVPSSSAVGLPTIGNGGFTLQLSNGRAHSLAGVHLAPERGELQLPPCTVYLRAPFTIAITSTNAAGQAQVAAPIPALTELLGIVAFVQWSVLDGVAGRLTTLSDALLLQVGR